MRGDEEYGTRLLVPRVRQLHPFQHYFLTIRHAALHNYEPRVVHYTRQLMNAIEKNLGKPMNVSKWFNYYSFDVMGDLSFGKSFNMLVDGKDSYILSQLHGDMASVGIFIHLTWLFPFFKRIPGVNKEYLKFWRFVEGSVVERIQVGISRNRCDEADARNCRIHQIGQTCFHGSSMPTTKAPRRSKTGLILQVMHI